MRDDRVVHMLPKERVVVKSVQRDSVGSSKVSLSATSSSDCSHSFSRSSCDFFGIISSMCGARSGYVSTIFVRMARCIEDLTFDLAPAEMLRLVSQARCDAERCYLD